MSVNATKPTEKRFLHGSTAINTVNSCSLPRSNVDTSEYYAKNAGRVGINSQESIKTQVSKG
jgi:hypothetical protein